METFIQDVRYGLRILIRNPSFAITVIGILGLGVGANTAIFSVVDAVLLEALPFNHADRLVVLRGVAETDDGPQPRPLSYPDLLDWRSSVSELEHLSAFAPVALNLTGDEATERVLGEVVSAGYFAALQVEPALGRSFRGRETEELDAHPVVVISDGLWRRRFESDPRALRKDLFLNGRGYRIVGIMPPGYAGVSMRADVWIPMSMVSAVRSSGILEAREGRWLAGLARLAADSSSDRAQTEVDAIAAALAEEFPESNSGRGAQVMSLRDNYVGGLQLTLTVLLASVGTVLLIACANITNLLLARSAGRSSELAVRQALGARRSRLARQVLTESLTLAACGGAAGVLIAFWAVEGLRAVIPAGVLPAYVDIVLSARVFVFTSIVTLGSGLVFGAAPAVRVGLRDLSWRLKRGGRGLDGAGVGVSVQSLLVAGQVALTAALLVCAGLMARSLVHQLSVDPGFRTDGTTVFRLVLPRAEYPHERRLQLARQLVAELESSAGLRAVAVGSDVPFRGLSSASFLWRRADPVDPARGTRFYRHRVDDGYLDLLGVELLAGRGFVPTDSTDSPRVALIGRSAAARLWPNGERAVGQRVRVGDPDGEEVEIVGIVGDVTFRTLTDDLAAGGIDPDIYFPMAQSSSTALELLVASDHAQAGVAERVREAVQEADAALAVTNVATLDAVLESQTAMTRLQSWLLGSFGGLALLLGAVGIYGLLAYLVARRDREIGIRIAMGATPALIVNQIVRRGMCLAGVGAAAGVLLGVTAARSMEALLFRVTRFDPVTLGAAVAVLLTSAFLASYVPARRAARVEPMRILRAE